MPLIATEDPAISWAVINSTSASLCQEWILVPKNFPLNVPECVSGVSSGGGGRIEEPLYKTRDLEGLPAISIALAAIHEVVSRPRVLKRE